MTFDRFNDDPMIGDTIPDSDQTECKQCGELFESSTLFGNIAQEFCNEGCKARYNGS